MRKEENFFNSAFLVYLILGLLVTSSLIADVATVKPGKTSVLVGFKGKPDVDLIKVYGGEIKYRFRIIPAVACSLPEDAIDALRNNPKIVYIEPDYEVYAVDDILDWGVDRIDAELVWSGTEDGTDVVVDRNAGSGIRIAILDTGIDYSHPDLDGNYAGGYDFVNNDADPKDDNGHGTHVAGIIAAEDNDMGVIGVAPYADIYAVKVLGESGCGCVSTVIAGIEWAVDNKMHIISMSLGTDRPSRSLKDACDTAYKKSLLLVAASGNYASTKILYPAAYSSVIAVGATDENDNLASFSNYGSKQELVAPGVNINSTMPTYEVYLTREKGKKTGYDTLSGTSMSTPMVSGVAALVWASNPSLTNIDVRNRLDNTAEDLGEVGKDSVFGYGLVDAFAAASSEAPQVHDVAVTAINVPSLVDQTAPISVDVTVTNEGNFGECFTVTLTDTTEDNMIGSKDVTLPSGASTTLTFTWDTASACLGNHTLIAEASTVEGEIDTSDNSMNKTVEVVEEIPHIHIKSIEDWCDHHGGRRTDWYIRVSIVDRYGNPVPDALVLYTIVNPAGGGLASGDYTGPDGSVTFVFGLVREGWHTFTVEDVSKEGYIYEPDKNEVNTTTIRFYNPPE